MEYIAEHIYFYWWIFLLAGLLLLTYTTIYYLEWKHPRYKLPHVHHTVLHWLQGCGAVLGNVSGSILMASYLYFISNYFHGLFALTSDNVWLQRLFSFVFLDFSMYAWHRANHIFRGLWKYHELHHLEKELNVFSTFHFNPKEVGLSTIWKIILLPLMGIEPAALIVYNTIFFAVILFHHSNFKLPLVWDKIVGAVIVTPGLHHLHHSVVIKETHSNYGSVFSFWDRIFGSNTVYKAQDIQYGTDPKIMVEEK